MAFCQGLSNERCYMKRIAGLAALLGLVAAACSDSPTAPTDTGAKLRVATPPRGAEAKAAWYKSMGFEQHQTGSSTSGLQYLIAPPPFWNTDRKSTRLNSSHG